MKLWTWAGLSRELQQGPGSAVEVANSLSSNRREREAIKRELSAMQDAGVIRPARFGHVEVLEVVP